MLPSVFYGWKRKKRAEVSEVKSQLDYVEVAINFFVIWLCKATLKYPAD